MSGRPSRLPSWPRAFDPRVELDWGDPVSSRRLLREHLDDAHDGASRKASTIAAHVRRLRRMLPAPPACVLDAACGPGLYAVPLAIAGHTVTGVDVGPAVVRHARRLAREAGVEGRASFAVEDLRRLPPSHSFDAVLLIYHVLESFPRREQATVLRRLAATLAPGGRMVVEVRLRPDQPPGRVTTWDVVPFSLLHDQPHLLLVETVHDASRATFVLRETAVFDDGSTAVQQTSSALIAYAEIERLFARAGLEVDRVYEGWSRFLASPLSDSALVVAHAPARSRRDRV